MSQKTEIDKRFEKKSCSPSAEWHPAEVYRWKNFRLELGSDLYGPRSTVDTTLRKVFFFAAVMQVYARPQLRGHSGGIPQWKQKSTFGTCCKGLDVFQLGTDICTPIL